MRLNARCLTHSEQKRMKELIFYDFIRIILVIALCMHFSVLFLGDVMRADYKVWQPSYYGMFPTFVNFN